MTAPESKFAPGARRAGMRPSLQSQLLAWSLGALLVVWLGSVIMGYGTGYHEADELTDGHLASVASIVLAKNVDGFRAAPDAATLGQREELRAHDYQQSMSVVVWAADGSVRARIGSAPLPPFDVQEGFQTVSLGQPARPWRVFSRWDDPAHARKVSVLMDLEERDALAADIAEQVATPGLWLLPVVALVLILAVRRGLRPLHALSDQVRQIDIHQPRALEAPPHAEFQSMVKAIDLLSERYATAMRHEREVADGFAHELRTPLASLRLHAGTLRGAMEGPEREAALLQIEADAERAAAVVRDLLALARASRLQLVEAAEPLDLSQLARRIVAEYGQTALDSGHEIALEAPDAAPLRGHPVLLEIALRNLMDNALAHTPLGTSIEVRVGLAPLCLEVCDNGHGLQARQPAAGDRKVGAGLGLGHQVIRRVADAHGGRFEVQLPEGDKLRCYRIVLEA